jgi:tetraether lipid synthase
VAEFFRSTESLCPVCLARVPARLLAEGEDVVLEGSCPLHGGWQTLIWSGPPSFASWCGSDPSPAARQTCTAVVEVTRRCDLACPLCFAESSPKAAGVDASVGEIAERLSDLFAAEGAVNVQLSGGEPTTRDDLAQIVEAACAAGFTFVQLNTNGIRLASEEGYAEALREAGLASVFLQFDGITDDTYWALRGRPLAAQKTRAIERCAEAGLAVVLVPTVVAGVNDGEIGLLVRLAASWPGVVRGLHFQPVSYFGRYPQNGRSRLTLPEMLRALESQAAGEVSADDFAASCCEHPRCSFRARYWVRDGGRLEPVLSAPCCCTPAPEKAAQRAVAATSRQWSRRPGESEQPGEMGSRDDLSRFLDEADRILAISGMLFQDAWSVDLERIGRCCVQVVTKERRLVPFCLWNLTSESGRRLYPRC